jgi:hypothetical protein
MSQTNCFDYSPILSGACVVALDKYLLGEQNMTRSLYLGGATVGGIYAGQMIAPLVPFYSALPSTTLYNNKTLELRLLELGLGAGGTYGITKFTPVRYSNDELTKKIGIIVAGSIAGSYINDYLTSKPMQYLQ